MFLVKRLTMLWILVLVALTLFVYFYLMKPFEYWHNKRIPSYRFWTVWKETTLGFMQYRTVSEAIEKVYKDFPGARYCGGYRFYKLALSLNDPELVKQIFIKDFDHFVDHTQFLPEDIEPLLKNLVFLKGDKWKDMRSILSPSFTSSKMKMMFGVISESANHFVQYFQEQDSKIVSVDMKDAFARFASDVMTSNAFGVSCNSLRERNNEFYIMGKNTITTGENYWIGIKTLLFGLCPSFMKSLRRKLPNEEVRDFFRKVIQGNIESREKNKITRLDMLSLLMDAKKNRANLENHVATGYGKTMQKDQLTDDDVTAQAMNFYFAGFQAVAMLMCYASYELALNPDIQQRLQKEVDDTFNHCEGALTYEALSKMKFLDMVVSETLRKWPVVPGLDRVCTKPYTIEPGKTGEKPQYIEKGVSIFVPIFGMHRDPQFFPEPERFDPERFSDENKSNINPYTYLPFGTGPRNCIGKRLVLLETKVIIFHILCKFDITVVGKTPIPIKISKKQAQMHPDGEFWLGLRRRDTI